jgi:hypothetical protein
MVNNKIKPLGTSSVKSQPVTKRPPVKSSAIAKRPPVKSSAIAKRPPVKSSAKAKRPPVKSKAKSKSKSKSKKSSTKAKIPATKLRGYYPRKNKKGNSTIAIIIGICAFAFFLISAFFIYTLSERKKDSPSSLIEIPKAGILTGGSNLGDSTNLNNTSFQITGSEMKELFKVLAVIGFYIVCIFYSIKRLKVTEVLVLLPFIFILTLPLMLKYLFNVYSTPTEEPFVIFLLLVVTVNLWYTLSYEGNVISDESKSISINLSVILVFLYIVFRHYYNNSTSEALMRAVGLAGASGVFMVSAPIYAYFPK